MAAAAHIAVRRPVSPAQPATNAAGKATVSGWKPARAASCMVGVKGSAAASPAARYAPRREGAKAARRKRKAAGAVSATAAELMSVSRRGSGHASSSAAGTSSSGEKCTPRNEFWLKLLANPRP